MKFFFEAVNNILQEHRTCVALDLRSFISRFATIFLDVLCHYIAYLTSPVYDQALVYLNE